MNLDLFDAFSHEMKESGREN